MKVISTKISPNTAILSDIHACNDMLVKALEVCRDSGVKNYIFLGDILDRGPKPLETLKTLLDIKEISTFLMGNHDRKYIFWSYGRGVGLSPEQAATIDLFNRDGPDTLRQFCDLFYQEYVALIDEDNKIMLSHAPGAKPARFVEKYHKHEIGKNDFSRLLFGLTNGDTENGLPVRLQLSERCDDDLGGWHLYHGHTHGNRLFTEPSPNIFCLDFKAGQPDGRLACRVFDNDVRNGRLLVINQQLEVAWNPESDMLPYKPS